MKQSEITVDSFCKELRHYNKTHRLIGNVSCETLLSESKRSIAASSKELAGFSLMVDVGAGSGVLGCSWLLGNAARKVVFLEPDKKAAAFLHMFFSNSKRTLVLHKRLEALQMEDLLPLEENREKIFLAARAFSSSMSLVDCYKKSGLSLPLFSFEKTHEDTCLRKIL